MAKFVVCKGAGAGSEIPMDKGRLVFGRGEDCDVVIVDGNVSRLHAQAVLLDDMVALMDLNSSNGTCVNGLPISRIFLMDGDEIQLGETVLAYVEESSEVLPHSASIRRGEFTAVPAAVEGEIAAGDESVHQTQLFSQPVEDFQADALKEVYLKLKTLFRVLHEIAQAQNLKGMLDVVGRAVTVSTETERFCFLFNAEKSGGEWEHFFTHAATRVADRALSCPMPNDVLDAIREGRKPILARLCDGGKVSLQDAEASIVAIPFLRGNAVSAVFYADNPVSGQAFSKNDLDLLSTLAIQVGTRLNQFQQVQQLKQENVQLRRRVEEDQAIIVQNHRMKEIMAATARVAETDTCVLVTGESGTGKELVARAIHSSSRRSSKSLVAVNCAALAETLLESELFGHEKGAFTGAIDRRIGKFELADGGTLFLDEIGDISAAAQAKLLRALQEGEIQRVGGTKTIKVNVRLIAATNKNLAEEVQKGTFRQDLFFRIKVVELHLPPLRERRDDIPALAEYFLKQLRNKFPSPVKSISKETMDVLLGYSFPGNVRELRNVIERGLVFSIGDTLMPDALPMEVFQAAPVPAGQGAAPPPQGGGGEPLPLDEVEKRHIEYTLRYAKGNKVRAAQVLGISRTTLYEKLKLYGLVQE